MANGDITVYKVDSAGIVKHGSVERKLPKNPEKFKDYHSVADVVLTNQGGKPILYSVQSKGTIYSWEIIMS